MPKVSILIPIQENENSLNECLDIALSQTLSDIEIIILVDESLDISDEKYKTDSRIKIYKQTNSSYGSLLNLGIENANSKYIFILNQDIKIDNNAIENLSANSECDIVKFKSNINSETGIFSINEIPEIIDELCINNLMIFKKKLIADNNIKFDISKTACFQDISFYAKMLFSAKTICIIDKLQEYKPINKEVNIKIKTRVNAIYNEFDSIYDYLDKRKVLPETYNHLLKLELNSCINNYQNITPFYKKEYMILANKNLSKRCTKPFFKSNFISFLDKINLYLFIKNINLMITIFGIATRSK